MLLRNVFGPASLLRVAVYQLYSVNYSINKYSVIKMETVPDICWILNVLCTVPSILDSPAYPYDTDAETDTGKVIFPWLVLANQYQK